MCIRGKNGSVGRRPDRDMVNKFGRTRVPDYFYARNAKDYKYKADQEDAPIAGKGLIFLYVKIVKAFPQKWEGFLISERITDPLAEGPS